MSSSNWDQELAEMRIDQERDAGVARISEIVHSQGETVCITCDEEISAERRSAYPAARRCTECQESYERWLKRRTQR